MASLEDELDELKERNNELVRKVQFWKMEAAQRENEKVNLMKEINELRLQLSRIRSNGNVQASNFETALQSTSEKALALLVRASGEIATTMDLAKAYMRDRQELNAASVRWSSLGSTPNTDKKDKVHRVPPLMMGGQSIQPVVALTMLNTSTTRAVTRSPNQNRNVTQRAVPMHMLQDVYIPLTRIDVGDLQTQNMETAEANEETEDSSEDLALDDIEDRTIDESQHMSEDEHYDNSRRLESVLEDVEPEEEETPSSLARSSTDNPLEGPSWLLDNSADDNQGNPFTNLEPDSTTGLEETSTDTSPVTVNNQLLSVPLPRTSYVFSPTVRRRKRTSAASPADPAPRRALLAAPSHRTTD